MTTMLGATLFSSESSGQWIEADQLKGPFVDSEPFDVIFLNKEGEEAILKVLPLDRRIDTNNLAEQSGQLVFEYFAESIGRLEVPYSSIDKIKRFNDLLMEEARVWLGERDYPRAFRNLLYVYDHGGKQDGTLVELLNNCLSLDGKENFETGEYELALSSFEDIFQKNPQYRIPGIDRPLSEVVMACYDGMIQKQFDVEDYIGVRVSLASVVDKYGPDADILKNKWSKKFIERSDALASEARKFAQQGLGREAHLAAKKADQMSPGRPEILALQEQILLQFPLTVVGVTQTGADADPNRLEHWGARRVGRLTQRTLVELTGLTDEGGKYEFLNGIIYRSDEVGLEYTMELKDDLNGFAIPPLEPFQIWMRLNALGDENSPSYNESWEKIVLNVSVPDERRVKFTLRSPYVRPEALLKTTYQEVDESGQPVQNGAYVLTTTKTDFSTFEVNPLYERVPGRQHPVLVEQLFKSPSEAVDELISGNIDVVDRIPLSDVARLKAVKGIEVRPYLIPTVALMVPKIRGKLALDPNFRNGLSHAIDRDLLVQTLCGNQELDGCEPLSGPFPIGTEDNDQISYGYDLRVPEMAFNTLLGGVFVNLSTRANPPVRPDPLPTPKLVIAYAQGTNGENAVAAIARMWETIGVETSLRELPPGETVPDDDQWDFLYLELSIEEPLADAPRVIGPNGFAKDVSAPVEQTLRNLSYAESWQIACSTLRRLHRQTSVDLSIIPLWQMKEHYAFRTTVREIGRDLVHLYQNVDRWKIDLTAEQDKAGK